MHVSLINIFESRISSCLYRTYQSSLYCKEDMASTKMPLGASSAHNVAEVAHTMKPKDRSASVKPKDGMCPLAEQPRCVSELMHTHRY